jgi:hypothetical protein
MWNLGEVGHMMLQLQRVLTASLCGSISSVLAHGAEAAGSSRAPHFDGANRYSNYAVCMVVLT